MSPLLRRLGVTRRRSRADLERALEVAETDRDIARAEKASAHEALGKVAAAAGRPGAPTRWNVEDLVQWVAAAGKVEDQRDTLGAELVAVDDALAELGAGPADDRVEAIRKLTRIPPDHLPVCALPDGHHGEHEFAADPWCSADLDGSPCVRPVGHTEPCSAGPAVSGNMQCRATGEPVAGRCELVAGHPGDHEWAAV